MRTTGIRPATGLLTLFMSLAATADGGSIVFESDRSGDRELYVINPDGSGLTQITNSPSTDGHPSWSPDGSKVVFNSYRDGNFELYVADANGANPRRITNTDAPEVHPAWSPDGKEIAYTCRIDDQHDVCVIGVDGTGYRRLTTHPETDNYPAWSPDGKRIAWTTDRPDGGRGEIWTMDAADGGNKVNLTNSPHDADAYPDWSPDGRQIVFMSRRQGSRFEIYVMNADGSNLRQLTHDGNTPFEPTFSPDGKHVVYQSRVDGNWEIVSANVATGRVTNLTNDPGNDFVPDWGVAAPTPLATTDPEIGVTAEVEEIDCDRDYTTTRLIESNITVPANFLAAIENAFRCGMRLKVAVLNDADQWIVATDRQIAHSVNVPQALADKLQQFEAAYGTLDAADLTVDGRWLVAVDEEVAEANVPLAAMFRATRIIAGGERIISVALHPQNPQHWMMIAAEGALYGEGLHEEVNNARARQALTGRKFRLVRYMGDGSFVLFDREQWYVSDGLWDTQLRKLNQLRTNGRDVAQFLGYQKPGAYFVVSRNRNGFQNNGIGALESNLGGNLPTGESGYIFGRMAKHGITGAALAIVRNNEIAWARGYGLMDSDDLESFVKPYTTFDFASVSKPVAALSLMQLAQAGVIDLGEEGELEDLVTLIPPHRQNDFRDDFKPSEGNIAQVLQHCAGFCYELNDDCHADDESHGAAQYALDAALPTTGEVLVGEGPANSTRALIRNEDPGTEFQYSTGNYNIVQGLIDVHAGGFVAHTDRLFDRLNMNASTFASPYAGRDGGNFARGHENGIRQDTYAYAELAGASLVSNVLDIARFVIAMNQDGGEVLDAEWFDKWVGRDTEFMNFCSASELGNMALGVRRTGTDSVMWAGQEVLGHDGDHNGYHAKMRALPGIDTGLVLVMTGSQAGADALYQELVARFVAFYKL